MWLSARLGYLNDSLKEFSTLRHINKIRISCQERFLSDRAVTRGECGGNSGIFPSSFVRIIDSFPGGVPSEASTMAYREAEAHQGHQYDNTRPAFGDLDAGLKAAFAPPPPKVSQSSLTHGATMAGCLGPIQTPSTPPQLTPPPQKLPPPPTSQPAVNAKARAPKPPVGQGPRRVSDSLTMALRRGKAKAPSPPAEKEEEEGTGDCSSGHRYQNAQFGYNDEKVKVRPYAIALHSFVPQFDNELGFSDGDVVYLTRQVDADWMEGELSTGETGIFPKSYVNVIVDVSPKGSLGDLEFLSLDLGSGVSSTRTGFLEAGAIYKVAFSFTAETATDVSLVAGEEVTILSHTEENWANVKTSVGLEGQCPVNHLNTCPEPGMDVVHFVSQTGGRAHNRASGSRPRQNNHLKFFDPLCSPDEEMLQIETELIRKATEKADIPVNPGITLHKNINLAPLNGERPRHRFKSSTMGKEQSIESFITQNLAGLKEIRGQKSFHQCQPLPLACNQFPLLPSDQSRTSDQQKQTFQISDSVRQELMDRMDRNRQESSALTSLHRLEPGGKTGPNEKCFLGEEEMYNQHERRRGDEMYEDPDSSSEFLPSSPCPCPEPISSEHLTSSDQLQSLESLYAKVNISNPLPAVTYFNR